MGKMALALKRIKVYGKLTLAGAAALVLILLVFKNRGNTVDVWFFHAYTGVPVLLLVLVTAVAAVVAWWALGKIVALWWEMRQLRRDSRFERQANDQRRIADELADREKRIDEKVRRNLTDES
jgi:hypothetical protein